MNDHMPPLSALRAFEAAARHMSFSKAADELFVTPAAISHQIHTLEQDLGIRLFHRLNRSVELTASARVLLPGLSEAFAGLRASVRRLRAHNDTGTLTVTASPSFAAKWLVLRLHRFQERCPEVDVRISATDEVVDLSRGDFDSKASCAGMAAGSTSAAKSAQAPKVRLRFPRSAWTAAGVLRSRGSLYLDSSGMSYRGLA